MEQGLRSEADVMERVQNDSKCLGAGVLIPMNDNVSLASSVPGPAKAYQHCNCWLQG